MICVVPTAVTSGYADGFELERIFPNPVETKAMLSANLPHEGLLKINVIDMQGRQVGPTIQLEGKTGLTQTWWQRPEGTAAGLYLVNWEWDGHFGSQRMLLK